ncbi:PleD family two-component system response regulator [Candidatus Viadribacter manganicus]|uniref:diguanylate cyclase n=1 Tax=Candidatus Viadribacter manganicus TaxID=1759059 RepID=A0A1B1AM20_9PROT|nr:PleD family two-component system response regulator [Candidatus Viadribacter manganicus]ANP47622.1 diguanylate cyclase response regulator [Candidatus Viadribacter manganicus]
MSARILVVDDLEANRRLLEALLTADYYEVMMASRGEEAVQLAKRERPDLILLDVMMPGGIDGYEACRRLKAMPETRHIPVVILTTLDDRDNRVRGLQAGAEEFLTKPIDDVQLMARVKSLLTLKVVIDELRAREANGRRLGVITNDGRPDAVDQHRVFAGNVLVVDDNPTQIKRIQSALGVEHRVSILGDEAGAGPPDLAVVSVHAKSFDGFRVIARMRSGEATRHLPILAIVDPDDRKRAIRALELGAHDIILRPIDEEEIIARARTLMRRKRYMDALRQRLDQSLELAITDQLTGLYNRRFLFTQLEPLVQRAQCGGDAVSIMAIDIDYFKRCNDTFGHDVGDAVLREFAARLASNTRPSDYACRQGGEEFIVVMPRTTGDIACLAAERLRRSIASSEFIIPGLAQALEVTISIGVASTDGADETTESLLKRADEALYEAKRTGRNRVIGRTGRDAA